MGLSLAISVLILISLAYTCLKSYSTTKSRMAGIYALAIIALSVQLSSAFFYVETSLGNKPEYITPERNPWISYFVTPLLDKLLSIYNITKIISFIAVWVASILLTKSYAQKTSKIKYWTIVCIPVIYLLFQYSFVLLNQMGVLSSLMMSKGSIFPYFYNFALNTVNVGSGIFIGVSFFVLSRSLTYEYLKYYVVICGTGLMIIFGSSVSQVLVLATFPAWSIVSMSFILPGAFLTLVGLGSATFHIAGDITLRRFLHKFRSQFELFSSLGSTEGLDAIERRIHRISNEIYHKLEPETMFVAKPESEDIKRYVSEVLAEMKKTERKSDSSKLDNFSDESNK